MRALAGVLAIAAACLAAAAAADPVTGDKVRAFKGRWVTAGAARCDAACESHGARAEHMLMFTSDGEDVYLCRVRRPPFNRFGTNYGDRCKVEDAGAQAGTALVEDYECLCIWPEPN